MTETVLLYLPLQPSVKTVVEELNGYVKLSAEFIGLPTEIRYQVGDMVEDKEVVSFGNLVYDSNEQEWFLEAEVI